ncbi:hypothetical protein CI109_102758 [Kwoniella shandongensis]|uniref:Uncharacterized protein n=1 Tax=Kwoniella shandongensis TaxID=1734106 RepID=A0A5M6BV28_9TREE|nr:uncharacterized protein CI109_004920 [Kwoniella shandongensis]KAA5526717.1 hypothetical protein CI109_004920 [Kwoniella shandongensis]
MSRHSQLLTTLLGLTLFALLNVSVGVAAVPVVSSLTSTQGRQGDNGIAFPEWPETGYPSTTWKRKDPTNGDRIKRGLNPLPPQKRNPTPTHQLLPRLSPAPQQAATGGYGFAICTTFFNYALNTENIVANNVQLAVDECSSRAQANSRFNFVLAHIEATTYACQLGISNVIGEECNGDNYGLYEQMI